MQQNKSFNKGKLLETLENFIESSKVVAIEKLLDGCVFAQDFDRIFLQDSSNEDTDSSTNYKDKKTADLSNLEQTLQTLQLLCLRTHHHELQHFQRIHLETSLQVPV